MSKKRAFACGLSIFILLASLLSVFSNASETYNVKTNYLFSDDFETNTFWSSGRTVSNTAFSGNYVIKGNSNSSYVYSNKLPLELNVTYTFGFWYRNPDLSANDKVAVCYKNSGRYTVIKSVKLEQSADWKYCSFEFKHSKYSDFYFALQGTDVEIDSVTVPYTYSTTGNLIKNGSFEKGTQAIYEICENSVKFSGNAAEGVACAVLNTQGGLYCDFDTVPFAEYRLSFKYKGSVTDACWALSRVRNGLCEADLITDKKPLSSVNEWKTVTFDFNSGNRKNHRFILWASNNDEIYIDSVSVTVNESKNILQNGSFESGTSGWNVTDGSLTVSNNSNSGEKSLIQPSFIYRKVWQAVDVEPNTQYLLSFCYKGSSWLKWVVCDASLDSQAGYAPNTDKDYIIGNSSAVYDSVNWDNITVTFNSGSLERIAFAIQSASNSCDLLFDDISITKINITEQAEGYFDSFGKRTPYNNSLYITDNTSNLFGDSSFEDAKNSAWNTNTFLNQSGLITDDGENGKVYKFIAGDSETVNSITFDVLPNTDYWLTLKVKNPPITADNTYKFTFGLANTDTMDFLLGKEIDSEQYRVFTPLSQLSMVAADDKWHLISAKYHTNDETKLTFIVKGTKTVAFFDDVYLFKDSDRKRYISETEKLTDIKVTNSSPSLLYYNSQGENLFENGDFSNGEDYWNTKDDGNVFFGTKLSLTDSGTEKYGISLNYSNKAKYPNRNYYIKWVDVKPDTEYTFAAKCRILEWKNDKYIPSTEYSNAHTFKSGSFGILGGYGFESDITQNQLLPTPILEYKFSSQNYNNSDWKDVAVSFNTNDKNRIGFMVYDGGGEAFIDDIRLFETVYATSKVPSDKPECPKAEFISFDKSSIVIVRDAIYGISTDNVNFSWQTDNLFTGLKADTQYYFAVKYPETEDKLESLQSDSLGIKTYKKGDINRDSKVNVKDLVGLKKNIAALLGDYVSDLNADGEIGAGDLIILRKILLNLI